MARFTGLTTDMLQSQSCTFPMIKVKSAERAGRIACVSVYISSLSSTLEKQSASPSLYSQLSILLSLRTTYCPPLPHRHANWVPALGVEDSQAYTPPFEVVGEDLTSSRHAPFLSFYLKIAILLSRDSNSQSRFSVSTLPFSNLTSTRSRSAFSLVRCSRFSQTIFSLHSSLACLSFLLSAFLTSSTL